MRVFFRVSFESRHALDRAVDLSGWNGSLLDQAVGQYRGHTLVEKVKHSVVSALIAAAFGDDLGRKAVEPVKRRDGSILFAIKDNRRSRHVPSSIIIRKIANLSSWIYGGRYRAPTRGPPRGPREPRYPASRAGFYDKLPERTHQCLRNLADRAGMKGVEDSGSVLQHSVGADRLRR